MVVALVVLAFAGCGDAGDDAGARPPASSPDAPVTGYPPSSSPVQSGPRRVEPEGGLQNVIPTAWQDAKVARDGLSVRLTWYSGVEECYGLDRVAVYPREEMVVITLFSGTRPDAETCIELAEKVVTVVELEDPVGDREIVDGALPD